MITSWKTSLVGALVIIAASIAMAFGGLDKTAGGLLVTVGVGLILARDDKGGGAPPAPPLPALLLGAGVGLLVVAPVLALAGCVSPLTAAIASANSARAIGDASRTVITAYCVPAYRAANTAAQLATVDARCLPAERAYVAFAGKHAAAVVLLQRAQLGLSSEADALAGARAVGQAGAALAAALPAVSP